MFKLYIVCFFERWGHVVHCFVSGKSALTYLPGLDALLEIGRVRVSLFEDICYWYAAFPSSEFIQISRYYLKSSFNKQELLRRISARKKYII